MLKEIIPSKFKIVDGNCSGDSQSFNGLVVLNDYFCLRVCDIDTFILLYHVHIHSFNMLDVRCTVSVLCLANAHSIASYMEGPFNQKFVQP